MLGAYQFVVSHYKTPLKGLQSPLKLAHLSDLHVGLWIQAGSVRAWVEATNAQAPDAVVITGDLTDSWRKYQVWPGLEPLSQLKAPLGVYAVWGNHDYRYNHYQTQNPSQALKWHQWFLQSPPNVPMQPSSELAGYFSQLGIQLLNNQGVLLRPDLYLAGVDDLWHGHPDINQALAAQSAHAASLLIAHNPDFLYQVPPTVGLTLCGHTHGGQIVLPGYGPISTSSEYKNKFAGGWVDDPVKAFISRGLGVASVPLRYRCDAEIVIHELCPS